MNEVGSELVVTFRYQYEDHRKAFLRNYFAQKPIIALLIIGPIILISALVFWLIAKSYIGFNYFEYTIFFLVLAMFLLLILGPFITLPRIKHQVQTTYQYDQVDHTAGINSQGLYWKTQNGEFNLQWMQIYKVNEQKEAFCFFFNSREFRILPKRVLEEEQIKFLRDLLRDSLGPKFSIQELDKLKRMDQ